MDELELLARLIQCEAGGEGDIGMSAVASVIMNRVHIFEGEYGRYNTVRDVAYAPRQFECITGSHPTQNIWNMVPESIHYAIAEWAYNGGRLGTVGNALWFYNPYSPSCRTNFPSGVGMLIGRIGNHCFYAPTTSYYNT